MAVRSQLIRSQLAINLFAILSTYFEKRFYYDFLRKKILHSTFPYGGLKNINDGFAKILIVKVVEPAHCPAVGVNV
jgi:hypothetical protein